MPLTNKYLKYSPEITLEIFTLVWDKLINCGWKPYSNQEIQNVWKYLTRNSWYGIRDNGGSKFIQYKSDPLVGLTETTVQEILGYDPFVEDDFVLPKKWCIKSQSRGQDRLINEFARSCGGEHWSDERNHARSNYLNIIDGRYCRGSIVLDRDFTEITFDQFKKYVLKESIEEPKEVIPEYVKCTESADKDFIVDKIYKCEKNSTAKEPRLRKENGHISSLPWNGRFWVFKPSTKEAFDAQNQPESVNNNGFFVALQNKLTSHPGAEIATGKIYKAYSRNEFNDDRNGWIFFTNNEKNVKWFATKAEAEEFAKTLVESVKEKVKQPLKQAVHCTTQEEWNFALSKFNINNLNSVDWNVYKEKSCLSLYLDDYREGYTSLNHFKLDKVKILSFQEWCDLNGYKMKSNQKFKVGDWVVNLNASMDYKINEICKISLIEDGKIACEGKPTSRSNQKDFKYFRHTTPEEINNHLISIGQIPTGEPLNTGIEPNKDGAFKYTTYFETTHVGKTATISEPLKMTLSIDDEELPMVNIIKTNTIKQLLNND